MKPKFFIITTISGSLPFFKGQLNVLKEEFSIHLVSGPGIHLNEMSDEYNVKKFPIEMEREISLWKDIKSLFRLYRLFKREKPMIVHGNTPKASLLSMIASWLAHVPVRIYYVHGLRFLTTQGFKKKLLIFMEKLSCFFATDVIAVSEGVKEEIYRSKLTSKKVELIWNGSINGIDVAYFDREKIDKAEIKEISASDFVFGFVGRIVRDKGINELVRTFDKLSKKYNDIKLLLVGAYEEADPLDENTYKIIQNNHNIISVGRQSDVRPFLKSMHIFVLPSYREGLCGVILEACSMEVPIIATDIMGIREVVKDGYNGKLIALNNEEQLCDIMEAFYTDKSKLKEYSKNGKEYVINNYEKTKVWKHSINKYKEIVRKHV